MSGIKISKTEQFYHENQTWERSLDFFKLENTFLKNRLSQVVDHRTDKEFLALAEQFQNQFILKDEFIDELRHDVNLQLGVMKQYQITGNKIIDDRVVKKQGKLRNEIEYLEKDFSNLRNEFNKYPFPPQVLRKSSNPFKVKGDEVEMDLLFEPIESLNIRFTFVKSVFVL